MKKIRTSVGHNITGEVPSCNRACNHVLIDGGQECHNPEECYDSLLVKRSTGKLGDVGCGEVTENLIEHQITNPLVVLRESIGTNWH